MLSHLSRHLILFHPQPLIDDILSIRHRLMVLCLVSQPFIPFPKISSPQLWCWYDTSHENNNMWHVLVNRISSIIAFHIVCNKIISWNKCYLPLVNASSWCRERKEWCQEFLLDKARAANKHHQSDMNLKMIICFECRKYVN